MKTRQSGGESGSGSRHAERERHFTQQDLQPSILPAAGPIVKNAGSVVGFAFSCRTQQSVVLLLTRSKMEVVGGLFSSSCMPRYYSNSHFQRQACNVASVNGPLVLASVRVSGFPGTERRA